MKGVIAWTVLLIVAIWGCYLITDAVFKHDMRKAEKACAALGTKPTYIKNMHYLCISPDGRVLGHG